MKDTSDFVKKFDDLSKDTGFQFVFHCDSCNKGYRSAFDQFNYGTVSDIADKVGEFLGGVAEGLADIGQGIEDKAYDSEHAKALERAVKKVKPDFMKCPECNQWVCKADCWNSDAKKCSSCSGETAQARQTSSGALLCSACGHRSDSGDTFCSECGSELVDKPSFCSQCGNPVESDDKFCPGCGNPI